MKIHIAPMPTTDEELQALIKRMMSEGCDELILIQGGKE